MSKKFIKITIIVLILLCGSAFNKPEIVEITKWEINAMDVGRTLRYDFVIGSTEHLDFEKLREMKQSDEIPGDHFLRSYGFLFSIRPNKDLFALMEPAPNTEYMMPRGFGQSGSLERNKQVKVHLEYAIKDEADIELVKKHAMDATFIVLYNGNIIEEKPLKSLIK